MMPRPWGPMRRLPCGRQNGTKVRSNPLEIAAFGLPNNVCDGLATASWKQTRYARSAVVTPEIAQASADFRAFDSRGPGRRVVGGLIVVVNE